MRKKRRLSARGWTWSSGALHIRPALHIVVFVCAQCSIRCFQAFALAAAATGMWDYHLAMAHHTVCLKVACRSNSLDKRHQLAQVYDEVCRRDWSERSFRGDSDFNIEAASMRLDPELFTRACDDYDAEFPKSAASSKQGQATKVSASVCIVFAFCLLCAIAFRRIAILRRSMRMLSAPLLINREVGRRSRNLLDRTGILTPLVLGRRSGEQSAFAFWRPVLFLHDGCVCTGLGTRVITRR